MNKTIIIFAVVLAVLGLSYMFTFNKDLPNPQITDYKNASYEIDGQTITLKDSGVIYFGNDVSSDFNGDGLIDEAFIITKDNGGSGTFYYVVVALKTREGGYQGTNAVFLGDRIAPQTTEFRDGEIIVNYAIRKPGEPMTTSPSVGVSKYLRIENGTLVEVVK